MWVWTGRNGRAGLGAALVVVWCDSGWKRATVPKFVNFAVVDTTHRLEENDLSNSGLETLARGLCNLTQLTAL